MVREQAEDGQQEREAEAADDEATDDCPVRRPPVRVRGVLAREVPGGEGDRVEAAQDRRDEERKEGRVVAPPDALRDGGAGLVAELASSSLATLRTLFKNVHWREESQAMRSPARKSERNGRGGPCGRHSCRTAGSATFAAAGTSRTSRTLEGLG